MKRSDGVVYQVFERQSRNNKVRSKPFLKALSALVYRTVQLVEHAPPKGGIDWLQFPVWS